MYKDFAIRCLVSIGLFIAGKMLTHSAAKSFGHYLFQKLKIEPTMAGFLLKVLNYAIWILVGTAILHQFGVQTTSILAILGAASVAIGLALQSTLSNIASGLVILALRPFRVGDTIEVDKLTGVVMAIGLFDSEIKTSDGLAIMCPNSKLWGQPITNFSRYPTRRINMFFGISYDSNVEQAKNVLRECAINHSKILKDPCVEVFVSSLDDSCVQLNLRAWVQREDYQSVYFFLQEEVKKNLENANIKIPYPHMELYVHKP